MSTMISQYNVHTDDLIYRDQLEKLAIYLDPKDIWPVNFAVAAGFEVFEAAMSANQVNKERLMKIMAAEKPDDRGMVVVDVVTSPSIFLEPLKLRLDGLARLSPRDNAIITVRYVNGAGDTYKFVLTAVEYVNNETKESRFSYGLYQIDTTIVAATPSTPGIHLPRWEVYHEHEISLSANHHERITMIADRQMQDGKKMLMLNTGPLEVKVNTELKHLFVIDRQEGKIYSCVFKHARRDTATFKGRVIGHVERMETASITGVQDLKLFYGRPFTAHESMINSVIMQTVRQEDKASLFGRLYQLRAGFQSDEEEQPCVQVFFKPLSAIYGGIGNYRHRFIAKNKKTKDGIPGKVLFDVTTEMPFHEGFLVSSRTGEVWSFNGVTDKLAVLIGYVPRLENVNMTFGLYAIPQPAMPSSDNSAEGEGDGDITA